MRKKISHFGYQGAALIEAFVSTEMETTFYPPPPAPFTI